MIFIYLKVAGAVLGLQNHLENMSYGNPQSPENHNVITLYLLDTFKF
jgi:hypothetical protein